MMGRQTGAQWGCQMGVFGSLHEEIAVGIERRQQRDNVGMTLSEVCLCEDVSALCLGLCEEEVTVKGKAQRSV